MFVQRVKEKESELKESEKDVRLLMIQPIFSVIKD